jgi:hypothetical protein
MFTRLFFLILFITIASDILVQTINSTYAKALQAQYPSRKSNLHAEMNNKNYCLDIKKI